MGDIAALAQSIRTIGLLHPVVVTCQGQLIAGARRLAACQQLGWEGIPVRVIDLADILLLRAEHDENVCRENFTPSEAVAIGKALEDQECAQAKARKLSGMNQYTEPSGKFPEGSAGQSRDKVAAAVGLSGKTFEHAKVVVEAAHHNQALQPIVDEMDRTGNIHRAYREVKRVTLLARLEDISAQDVKALTGVYDVIVIDPPWPVHMMQRTERPDQLEMPYPTMSADEIVALSLPCADDSHVWLWTTHKCLPLAFRCLDAWGLSYMCTFVWHKPGGFQPWECPQFNCEFALYARKGSPRFVETKDLPVCFEAPRGKHSEKPEAFYAMVRRVTAGRRVDMFARRTIPGFDAWGNQSRSA
jgi:N6-adenosine-specific RNA methylase IME4/ParB-like chromosome segregation protein Spo0J